VAWFVAASASSSTFMKSQTTGVAVTDFDATVNMNDRGGRATGARKQSANMQLPGLTVPKLGCTFFLHARWKSRPTVRCN